MAEWLLVANRVGSAMAGLTSLPTVGGFGTLTRSFAHVANNPIVAARTSIKPSSRTSTTLFSGLSPRLFA
jgi:hypothetical protein